MLIAYIMTDKRELVIKPIFKKTGKAFMFKGKEYYISRNTVYNKKFFRLKYFFFSMYIENNPNPIEFKDSGIVMNDVPLNDIAMLIKMIRNTAMDNITLIASVCSVLVGVMCLTYIYQIYQMLSGA